MVDSKHLIIKIFLYLFEYFDLMNDLLNWALAHEHLVRVAFWKNLLSMLFNFVWPMNQNEKEKNDWNSRINELHMFQPLNSWKCTVSIET